MYKGPKNYNPHKRIPQTNVAERKPGVKKPRHPMENKIRFLAIYNARVGDDTVLANERFWDHEYFKKDDFWELIKKYVPEFLTWCDKHHPEWDIDARIKSAQNRVLYMFCDADTRIWYPQSKEHPARRNPRSKPENQKYWNLYDDVLARLTTPNRCY